MEPLDRDIKTAGDHTYKIKRTGNVILTFNNYILTLRNIIYLSDIKVNVISTE